jgi:Arc/MetJ family transcription regulator
MRTNIEIDDKLMKKAMKASGAPTKKAVVEEALQMLVRVNGQGAIRKWFGKIQWDGDLEWSRTKNKWEEAARGTNSERKAPRLPRRRAA